MVVCENDKVSTEDAIEVLRLQKHDFLNYLQIISGYLQLGNVEKALNHCKTATSKIERTGTIMRLAHPALSINLLLRVHNAYKSGVNIALSTSSDLKQLPLSDRLFDFFDQVFAAIEHMRSTEPDHEHVRIDFCEDSSSYLMTITVLSCSQGTFSLMASQVEEAANELMVNPVIVTTEGMSRQQIHFPKNTRSGQDVL